MSVFTSYNSAMHEHRHKSVETGTRTYPLDPRCGVNERRRQSCQCSLHTTVKYMSTVRSQLKQEQGLTAYHSKRGGHLLTGVGSL